jgi:hypothetical protein
MSLGLLLPSRGGEAIFSTRRNDCSLALQGFRCGFQGCQKFCVQQVV